MKIVTEGSFDAAHLIKGHKGKCGQLHGHTWRYKIQVEGPVDTKTGMVLDFGDIDNIVAQLDHNDLNRVFPNPTAENIVAWIQRSVLALTPRKVYVTVTLWESPRHYVEI